MDRIARLIFLPSLVLTLIAGLLSLAVNRSYQNAGWALTKLATGIIIFEWGFVAVQGPIQNEAALATRVLAGQGRCIEARALSRRRMELTLGITRGRHG